MQLNDFTGGLNLRLAPHLIGQNEGVIYSNIDTIKGSLVPLKQDTKTSIIIAKYIVNFKDKWISSDIDTTYLEFQEKLYYTTGSGTPQKSSNGVTFQNLGIVKPGSKPRLSASAIPSGIFDGVYQYCYTYYNNVDGTESQPSEYSNELDIIANSISVTVTASYDSQVDKIRIYRIGNNLTTMSLVTTLSNANQTYVDILDDLSIDSRILDSYNNKQAPSNLKYLTEANAMFFGAVSDKLWFSEIAYVNYWSEFNYIDFDSPITGIGNTQNGLLVFTKYKTYIVTGNSPSTLSKYLLDGSQGCLSHNSIAFVKGTLIWVSSDGVCGSSGGNVEVLSRAKLGNLTITNIKDSIVWDDVYYLSYSNSTLVVDFRFGVIFSNLDISPDSFYNYNDQVYYSNNSELYTLFTSTEDRSIEFKTGLLSDGSISTLKNYKNVYLNTTGALTFKTYINNELVSTKILNGGVEEIKFPQDKRLGYNIRFSFSGVGSVLEIAYAMEGRQNGR